MFVNKKSGKNVNTVTYARKLIAETRSIKEAKKIIDIKSRYYSFAYDRENSKVKLLTNYNAAPYITFEREYAEYKKNEKLNRRNLFKPSKNYEFMFPELKKQWVNVANGNTTLEGEYWFTFNVKFIQNDTEETTGEMSEHTFYAIRSHAKKIKRMNTRTISYNVNLKKQTPIREIIDNLCFKSFFSDEQAFSDIIILYIEKIKYIQGKDVKFDEVVMKGTKLSYKLLGDIHKININDGQCLIDYIMYVLNESGHFKTIKRSYVESFFNKDGSGTYKQLFTLLETLKYVRADVVNPNWLVR